MRISAKDCGFEQYNDFADIEVEIKDNVSLQVVNKKGEPLTGTETMGLSESEIKKIQDFILCGARKETIGKLLVQAKIDSQRQ